MLALVFFVLLESLDDVFIWVCLSDHGQASEGVWLFMGY